MSAVEPPRAPDYQIKEGTAVVETVVFADSAGAPYTPSTTPTAFRTNCRTGTTEAITFTYNGSAADGYGIEDVPNAEGVWLYEWLGQDSSQPDVTGDRVVRVTKSAAF